MRKRLSLREYGNLLGGVWAQGKVVFPRYVPRLPDERKPAGIPVIDYDPRQGYIPVVDSLGRMYMSTATENITAT